MNTENIDGLPVVKLYKDAADPGNPTIGPLNSLYVSFKIAKAVPPGCEFEVKVYIEATGALEGSLVSNLPEYSNAGIKCKYIPYIGIPDSGYIHCKNVGALLSTDNEYFVAIKAYYKKTAPDPTRYGKVEVLTIAKTTTGIFYKIINLRVSIIIKLSEE